MEKQKLKKLVWSIFLISIIGGSLGWGLYAYSRDHYARIIKDIPDPFKFENGTRISSIGEWNARRTEIIELIQKIEYGYLPGRPDAIKITEISRTNIENQSTLSILVFTIIPHNATPQISFNLTVWLFTPAGSGPFPVVVMVAKDGGSTYGFANQTALTRGYIYVCYNNTELDPDTQGYDIDGPAQLAYPEYDWGSIAVWAWGGMRVMDYLMHESWVEAPSFPNIDNDSILITGHSRRGKTALLAAALDTRFAMTAPSGSGCCGAGSFLIQTLGCETIASITSKSLFKSWFQENLSQFNGKETQLIFDQHFLRSLIAPRLILTMDGLKDYWANPIGTQAMYEAAVPVFQYLGAEKNNAIHYHAGGHSYTIEDFNVVLDFADKLLLNKSVNGDFYMTPYDNTFPIHYTAPK